MLNQSKVGDEYYFRCPECGDSNKDQSKAHWSFNVTNGLHFCYRCGYSGRLSMEQMFEYVGESILEEAQRTPEPSLEERLPLLEGSMVRGLPKGRMTRFSYLPRHHIMLRGDTWLDIFPAYQADGNGPIGYNCRLQGSSTKLAFTIGTRGLGFSGKIPIDRDYLRIVEGPYDCLYDVDVATYGLPSRFQWWQLVGLSVRLCPDPDVWLQPDLAYRYLHMARRYCWVDGVEWLPYGKDPDEVPEDEREVINLGQAFERVRRIKHQLAKGNGGDLLT